MVTKVASERSADRLSVENALRRAIDRGEFELHYQPQIRIDSGEVVLFWDCPPHAASKLARSMREEMALLDADEFLARWSAVER